ncbi:ABC transporter ATP-binding protein [Boudabousia marimammalium]|uniref:Iron ABC transporter ATP-binding protein n=1 Tax=Boudabousia marimammalium TaxID=156892 RepID=A0A1Q5PRK1_9ACTO|nr:ATP-binding cassette domain-containing protein [Boudabousia marimammalium]OKL50065.1 iron ABC transporter ATP-binding protein [Boudabousia marimammalium]
MDTVFSLNDVNVNIDNTAILTALNWRQKVGEHWVVLGPNGAGKTTLTKLLMGRLPATSGSVDILGEPVAEVPSAELNSLVGYSSSALATRLPARQTVLDVVLAAAQGRTSRFRESYEDIDLERAHNLLAAFSVAELAERLYGTLSNGEKQRVQVARAFMADPQALILDEPASGLDLGARENLLMALTELAGDHRSPAMLLVTHHLEEIPAGYTHVLIMSAGRVLHSGEIAATLTSENLSEAFGMEIQVESSQGRWWAHGRR